MKRFLRVILLIISLPILYLLGVIVYGQLTEYAPTEPTTVEIKGEAKALQKDRFDLVIWNVGYCGLGQQADFFMDGGKMTHSPKEDVAQYWGGIQQTIRDIQPSTDFFLLQEVDKGSVRSSQIDYTQGLEAFTSWNGYFGKNFDVRFVPVPFLKPLGKVLSGVFTVTEAVPLEATRFPFKGNYSWPTRLFQLDRCFLLTRFALDNTDRQLVVINTHNSAYDDGSLKQQQMEQLKEVLLAEYNQGNYVIVGGDWNQYPPGFEGVAGFGTTKQENLTAMYVPEVYPAEGWQWAWDPAVPTNRALAKPYDAETTPRFIIDFYLVSPNVEVVSVKGMELDFAFSDHQPVRLGVKLR